MCLTRCDQTEQATLSGGYLILEKFRADFPHITSLIKRSDNASILAGQATPEGDSSLSRRAGLCLFMRDYSEIQSGKDICDRIVGAAKLRMKAYLHAGHDITTADQIKIGMYRMSLVLMSASHTLVEMEYCGGVKHVKIGTAEMIDNASPIKKRHIPEISKMRNIVYKENHMILRRASEIGPGRIVKLSKLDVPINMQLVDSFEP